MKAIVVNKYEYRLYKTIYKVPYDFSIECIEVTRDETFGIVSEAINNDGSCLVDSLKLLINGEYHNFQDFYDIGVNNIIDALLTKTFILYYDGIELRVV